MVRMTTERVNLYRWLADRLAFDAPRQPSVNISVQTMHDLLIISIVIPATLLVLKRTLLRTIQFPPSEQIDFFDNFAVDRCNLMRLLLADSHIYKKMEMESWVMEEFGGAAGSERSKSNTLRANIVLGRIV